MVSLSLHTELVMQAEDRAKEMEIIVVQLQTEVFSTLHHFFF